MTSLKTKYTRAAFSDFHTQAPGFKNTESNPQNHQKHMQELWIHLNPNLCGFHARLYEQSHDFTEFSNFSRFECHSIQPLLSEPGSEEGLDYEEEPGEPTLAQTVLGLGGLDVAGFTSHSVSVQICVFYFVFFNVQYACCVFSMCGWVFSRSSPKTCIKETLMPCFLYVVPARPA